jgi:hypothetical protein
MPTNCFYQLNNIPTLPEQYINEALAAEFQQPKVETNGQLSPRTTRAVTSFVDSKMFQDIKHTICPGVHACYFRNEPQSLYDWHIDSTGNRKTAINFLLSDPTHSMMLYRKFVSRLNYSITACPYQLGQAMLLNVDQEHCVINLSQQYRYVLSVSLPGVEFDQAVNFFQNYSLDSY